MAKETYNKTISRPLADLHFHPANPRDHSEESTRRLADSIKEDPTYFEAHPILLSDRTGELVIIGGEGRCRAARFLGMTDAPTFLFEGLTEEDEVRIMQKDNDHSGKWNNLKLYELAKRWGDEKMRKWSGDLDWKLANAYKNQEITDDAPTFSVTLSLTLDEYNLISSRYGGAKEIKQYLIEEAK